MRILVTGGCGFTGSYVIHELIKNGHQVTCFIRRTTNREILKNENVAWRTGDLSDIESLTSALKGMDALVNVASIGFGHAPFIVQAAQKARIKRVLFFSTTAIFTTLNAPSKRIRLDAEKLICNSDLEYTIVRPTMIFGSSRDRNMCRLIRYIHKWPAIWVVGSGNCLQQPVYVKDLATAVANALDSAFTIRKCYNLPGKTPLSFEMIIKTISKIMQKNIRIFHLPSSPIVTILMMLEFLRVPKPIKLEQILRLNEDKAFDYKPAFSDFGYDSKDFKEAIAIEIEQMGLSPFRRNEREIL